MKYLDALGRALLLAGCLLLPEASSEAQTKPVEGVRVRLEIDRFAGKGDEAGNGKKLEVFTERPHLLGGLSFVLIAPEHPLLADLTAPVLWDEVQAYAEEAKKKAVMERADPARKATGMFVGSYVVQPLSGWRIPVWVSDAVAGDYPLQAWLGIPAHNQWQYEFARSRGIEVVPVIRLKAENGEPEGNTLQKAYLGAGTLVESGDLTGIEVTGDAGRANPAFAAAVKWLTDRKLGEAAEGLDYEGWAREQGRAMGGEAKVAAAKPETGAKMEPAKAAGVTVAAATRPRPESRPGSESGTAPVARMAPACSGKECIVEGDALVADGGGGEDRAGLNMMVDHSWLLAKPRMGERNLPGGTALEWSLLAPLWEGWTEGD